MQWAIIIREEIICLFVLIYFLIYNKIYVVTEEWKGFQTLCICAIGHVIFDLATVYSVNHMEQIPKKVNGVLHLLFFLFGILFCSIFLKLIVENMGSSQWNRKFKKYFYIPVIIFLMLGGVKHLTYVEGTVTNYIAGFTAILGYIICMGYLLTGLILVITARRNVKLYIAYFFSACTILSMIAITVQLFYPEILLTGALTTIITVSIFFALVNPAKMLRERAYFDVDTGIRNKNCYEDDIRRMDQLYFTPDGCIEKISCIICDLNGLKSINDRYGHLVGDEIIQTSANLLTEYMKSTNNVYRIGGDEFAVIHIGVSRTCVQSEIEKVKSACQEYEYDTQKLLMLAMGQAHSNLDTKSMKELIQQADSAMYKDKNERKLNMQKVMEG